MSSIDRDHIIPQIRETSPSPEQSGVTNRWNAMLNAVRRIARNAVQGTEIQRLGREAHSYIDDLANESSRTFYMERVDDLVRNNQIAELQHLMRDLIAEARNFGKHTLKHSQVQ